MKRHEHEPGHTRSNITEPSRKVPHDSITHVLPSERSCRRPGKRLLDLVLLLMILPLAVPLLLLLALAVRCTIGSPILFRQQRPGLYGTPFKLVKFRTMTNAHNEAGQLLPDSQRLIRFGRFLRSASLDELPELFNVLRGDMSLVGPRPLLMEYLERYTPEFHRRHHVLPGITGWAQVNGRNTTTWERRFALDLWYVDHHSLGLDLQILLLTPWKVIKWEGVLNPDSPSWEEEFKGPSSKCPPQAAREPSAFREVGK